MDQTAQQTAQTSQQQVRPMVEPQVRQSAAPQPSVPPQPVNTDASAVPSSVSHISIGREHGPVQVQTDDEDDTANAQQYTPVMQQARSEISRQSSPESLRTQAPPQEVVEVSSEAIKPAVPEVEVPAELEKFLEKKSDATNPILPPELQNYGVRHTIPQTAVPPNDAGIKELPLLYEEAVAKEKAFQFKDSMKWLAAKVHYYWRKVNPEVYK